MELSGSYKRRNKTFCKVRLLVLLHHCSDLMKTVKGMVENGLKWKKCDVALIVGYGVQVGEIGKRRNIWELCSCERTQTLQNTFWAAWEHWTNNPEPVKLHLHESLWHTCCTLLYPPGMAGTGYCPCVQDAGVSRWKQPWELLPDGLARGTGSWAVIPAFLEDQQTWLNKAGLMFMEGGQCRRWWWAGW